MKYTIFAILVLISVVIVVLKWKVSRSDANDQHSEDSKKSASQFEVNWDEVFEASVPWFWLCIFVGLIIFGLHLLFKTSTYVRAYWDERVYLARKADEVHRKTVERLERIERLKRSETVTSFALFTPAQLTVEEVDSASWQVTVPPNKGIVHTDIPVKKGEVIRFQAEGLVKWHSNLPANGPSGVSIPKEKRHKLLKTDAPAGSLLVKIGNKVFYVGRRKTIVAPVSGKLAFLINDQVGWYKNNIGSFSVVVTKLPLESY